MKLGFVFALESEFNAFKTHLNHTYSYQDPYYVNASSTHVVIISGVGKSNAAMATTRLVNDHDIDLIVNIGVAGGVGLKKGEVILVKKTMFHDVDVVAFGYLYGQIPSSPVVFKPSLEAYEKIKEVASSLNMKFTTGTVATGDQFVENLALIYKAIEIDKNIKAIEMELSSIALVAHKMNIPWISLKAISDEVGTKTQTDDFNKTLDDAMVPISKLIESAFIK